MAKQPDGCLSSSVSDLKLGVSLAKDSSIQGVDSAAGLKGGGHARMSQEQFCFVVDPLTRKDKVEFIRIMFFLNKKKLKQTMYTYHLYHLVMLLVKKNKKRKPLLFLRLEIDFGSNGLKFLTKLTHLIYYR